MAKHRMFAKSIITSGKFLRMPATSRLLYYDLGMAADDDGVVEAFTVMRLTGATEDDLRVLVSKGYIQILNEELVSYICDWNINNLIRKDRYVEGIYKELLVSVKDGNQTTTKCHPDDNQTAPQVKSSQDKSRQVKLSQAKSYDRPTFAEIEKYCKEKNYKTDPNAFFDYYADRHWLINGEPIRDWKKLLASWEQNEIEWSKKTQRIAQNPKNRFNNFQQRTYDYNDLEKQIIDI